jgi:hypothetical protein
MNCQPICYHIGLPKYPGNSMLIAAKGYVFLFNDIAMFFNGYDATKKD